MKKLEDLCIEVYNEFIREITLNPNYAVVLKDTDYKTIEKFTNYYLEKINKHSIGVGFLVYYCEYQFNYWRDMKTKFGKNVIYISWIFGKKAISRYDKHHTKIFSREIRQDIGQKILAKFTKTKRDIEFFVRVNIVEEKEKQRYLNKEEGLVWCIQNTTLFHPKSKHCLICMNSIDCKKVLQLNYPKLFQKRNL